MTAAQQPKLTIRTDYGDGRVRQAEFDMRLFRHVDASRIRDAIEEVLQTLGRDMEKHLIPDEFGTMAQPDPWQ